MNRQLAKQYFDRAETLREAGKPEEALALLNQLDEAFPDTKNIGVARVRTYAALGRITDAVQLCDKLIAQHDSRRARELKEQLLQGILEPDAAKPATASKPPRRFARIALLSIAIACGLGGAVWSVQRETQETASTDTARELRPKRMAFSQLEPQSSEPVAGRVHPRRTWELDEAGVPKWKSGIFRGVPCINEPERTLDVYLPMAYDEKPDALFPGVVIQMSNCNPGFIGLEDWAERSEVVLIVINTSCNPRFAENHIAQDRALETISTSLRVDQRMGFAIGMSGGGRASWQVACRYPENFQGIVMMGISGDEHIFMPPLHVRIGIIHGETDFNNRAIAQSLRMLETEGYAVREVIVPGGHVTGRPEVRIEMLNWMVHAARRDLGLPQPTR